MILEGEDKIKDLFSSKLQNFEPELPASLWVGIDQALSQQIAPAPSGSESASTSSASSSSASSSSSSSTLSSTASTVGKTTVWLKPVAAVATAVALTVAGVMVYDSLDKDMPNIVENDPTTKIVKIDSIVETIDSVAEEPSTFVDAFTPTTRRTVHSEKPVGTTIEKVDTVVESPDRNIKPETDNRIRHNDEPLVAKAKVEKLPKYYKPKGFTLGVSSSMLLSAYNKNQQGGIMTFSDPEDLDNEFVNADNLFKMKHSQPISFGLTVSKEISSNLSIETGIMYTLLSSTIEANGEYAFKEKQRFHYLGIPVSFNYTFFRYKNLNIYLSAGGMIQKDIKGQYTGSLKRAYGGNGITEGMQMPDQASQMKLMSTERSINQSNPQFSAHMKLGVTYPLYKKLYIYGTVGGIYYFDASNKYRTIYSDKSTQFDASAGLKLKF